MTSYRTAAGGRIDRGSTLRFTFDDRELTGHPGDTLASALLAAGVHQVGTSVRFARPRGIGAAWAEDPGGLVQIEEPFPEPMLLAATVELVDGLVARGVGGRGRLAGVPDPARYDAKHAHADLLVVGAGPPGLAAALTGAGGGPRGAARRAVRGGRGAAGRHRRPRRCPGSALGRGGHRRAGGRARRAAPAAHHRVRPLRRRVRAGPAAAHRPPRRSAEHLAAAGVADPRPPRAHRHRGARASRGLRRQRPSRGHGGRRRADVPAPLRRARRPGGGRVHLWLGPDEWLVTSPARSPRDLEAGLRAVGSGGAVVDVSAQRTTLRLRGTHVRDLLATGCALDLHPRAFPARSAAQTLLGLTGVVLLALDDAGTDHEVLVRSCFARYLADWLLDAATGYLP